MSVRKTSCERSWAGLRVAICDTSGDDGACDDEGAMTIIVDMSPSLERAAAEGSGIDPECAWISPEFFVGDPQIRHICWALKAEAESAEPLGRLYAESLGTALAVHLLRKFARAGTPPPVGALPARRLQRVLEYLEEHLTRDLRLAELANVAGASPSHFKVLFKRSVGLPVHQYVVQRRVDRAVKLLATSDLSLCDVALQSGFANQSHMARWVRRIAGSSPAALRKAV